MAHETEEEEKKLKAQTAQIFRVTRHCFAQKRDDFCAKQNTRERKQRSAHEKLQRLIGRIKMRIKQETKIE